MAKRILRFVVALWAAVGFVVGAPAALRAQSVAEVQVTPETMTLGVGQKQAIFAAAYDRQGNLIPSAKFTFWSSDTAIVRVLHDGTVVGMVPGLAKVEARTGGRRASLAVLITGPVANDRPPPGSVLTLDPAALTLLPGETAFLTPRAVREDGSQLALGRVVWKSLSPQVATVDSSGIVTGVSIGRSIVQATTSVGFMATAPVEVAKADFTIVPSRVVLGPGASDTVQALVPSQKDRRIGGGLRWRIADTTIAKVDANGVVVGIAPGTTELIAAGFGPDRRIPVVIHKAPQALVVSPSYAERLQIPLKGARKLAAIAQAADSTLIPEVPVEWKLRDTAVAIFDAVTKTVTAKSLGTTTVTATIAGFEPVVWNIEVVPGLVRVSQERIGIRPGDSTALDAALVDDIGEAIGGNIDIVWRSDQPAVALVGQDGKVRGMMQGRAMVTATTPWGQSDTTIVFVTGDLIVASKRANGFDLYATLSEMPDTLIPVTSGADTTSSIEGVYSPDRTRVAFSSNRAGSYDLYIADADGANPLRITSDAGDEREPVWTPDGTRLIYTATSAEPSALSQVHAVDIESGTSRALTTGPGGNSSPAIAHDGRTIVFVSTRHKGPDLYLSDIDGNNLRRLTDNGERELLPRFLPGGDVVYAVERAGGRKARVIRRTVTATQGSKLFETDQPIVALGVSRDGTSMAYAVGRVKDGRKGRTKFSVYLRPIAADGRSILVPLQQDEQISSLAF